MSSEEPGGLSESHRLCEEVDHLVTQGKIVEAIGIIEGRKKEEGIEELRWRVAESRCRNKRGEYELVIIITDEIRKEIEEMVEEKGKQVKRIGIDALKEQIWALIRLGKLEEGIERVEDGIRLLEELDELKKGGKREENEEIQKDKEREANLFNNKGVIFRQKGDLDQALRLFEACLAIKEEIGEKRGIGLALNNIGNIFLNKGEFDKALEFYEKSLVIKEQLGNKKEIAPQLNNIGNIYMKKGELDKALENYERSLVLREEIGNKHTISASLNNIGVIYRMKGELNQALVYYKNSLEMHKELGNRLDIASSLINIGSIYLLKGELSQALRLYEESLAMREEIGNKQDIATSYNSIGALYNELGELETALDYFKQSLVLRVEVGNKLEMAYSFFSLICVAIDLEEIEQARDYLINLQQTNKQENNKRIDLQTRLAEALILKMGKRRKNLTKAEELLDGILEESEKELISHDMIVQALINLSELLLEELKSTGEEDLLKDVEEKVVSGN